MDEAIREFERYVNRRYPGRSTAKHYVSDLQIFRSFVGKPAREVTRWDVDRFVEDQLAQGRSATTVNRRLACLHHFFEFLADEADDDAWANPVVWRRQRVKEGQPLPRDISDADVERLFAGIDHPRDRLMFGLMCWAGLRVGEVAALRVSDLIPDSSGEMRARLRVRGKGQKERVVPLTADLTQQWEICLARRPEVEDEAVFITRCKRRISVRGIQDRLTHYCRQAGLEVSCHQLRHTFGRQMAEGEMPLSSLSKMLGHAQVTTTQVYIAGAGVDVRADYEAAMGRLDAGCPGSPLFPATPWELADSPRWPTAPQDGGAGGEAIPPHPVEEPPDVSRFWAGLPDWVVEPMAEYIAHQQRRWKPSQVRRHTRIRLQSLRQVWRSLLEDGAVRDWAGLGRRDVEAYADARLDAGTAASTVNRELRDLWAFLRFVRDRGQPIAPGVFRVPRIKEGKPLPRFLNDEAYQRLEERILEDTAGGTRDDRLDQAWFYLLAHGGLRLSELCDLRVRDVDLAGRRLAVREGKGKRDRIIPLSGTAATTLREYLAVRGMAQTAHLLTFRQRPIKAELVQARLKRYGAAAGVEVSPHRLRHTLATRLLNAGMDIVSIQCLLGHEKLDTTMIYAHVHDPTVEQDFRQAMARLEARHERRAGTAQRESTPLMEEFFSHTDQPVSIANQEPDCV